MAERTRTQREPTGEAVSPEARALGYEPGDAPPLGVLAAIGGVIALMAVGLAVAALLLWRFDAAHPRRAAAFVRPAPPAPRLLADPRGERVRLEAAARARAGGSIDRAMRDTAAAGWRK